MTKHSKYQAVNIKRTPDSNEESGIAKYEWQETKHGEIPKANITMFDLAGRSIKVCNGFSFRATPLKGDLS